MTNAGQGVLYGAKGQRVIGVQRTHFIERARLPAGHANRPERLSAGQPDGQIVKVLSDAPNGQPQWVLEDVRPDLYVPAAGHPAPQTPGEVGEAVRLTDLEARTQQLLALHAEVVAQLTQINRLQAELSSRVAALSTPPPEPQYVVRVFGYEIPVRKR